MSQRKNSTITKRWILNTLLVIVFVLIVLMTVALLLFKHQYYETVRVTLDSRATVMVDSFFALSSDGSEETFNMRAKDFVESFHDKSIMEVWVIDRYGHVVISSSGFSVEQEKFPDYYAAKTEKNRKATWIGKTSSGEHIMALSYMLEPVQGQMRGAVRFLISLEEIDHQLITVFFLLLLLSSVILTFVTVSGMFFIRSIVQPVKKINEAALRISEGDLNTRIEEGNSGDEIDQLTQTINNMAAEIKESDRLKNEFISTVSHELRTPLTAIKGWGETILDAPTADAALTKQGLEVIIKESERLSELVEELLDFSRMETGKMTLRLASFDVLDALKEIITAFSERSARENIQLDCNIPQQQIFMRGDQNRIKQVFVNILDNAFKYTSSGGRVQLTTDLSQLNSIAITVTDSGCGIPKADLPHVTEKFYKANTSVRGSGIGLAVVSEIIALHEGTLKIESEEGIGTTVVVTLPVQEIK